mgnify:CR=1 FL=1|tara:strand:- start:96 stop:740 length:645 start_codon:yes stop_codon:yes gene_type:complete
MKSSRKDAYRKKTSLISASKWKNQPVAIVDMDDVLVKFRAGFSSWIEQKHNVKPNILSKEYYFIEDLKSNNIDPEKVFLEFISDDGFLNLKPFDLSRKLLTSLKEKGYWVHILTARPGDNMDCVYDTFSWLAKNDMPFDNLSFSSDKLAWCKNSEYNATKSISFAIDDSPKHAERYSSSGFVCHVPKKTYNTQVWEYENIKTYDRIEDLLEKIK